MSNPSICVFCGSRSGKDPAFHRFATELGALMAARNWRLVYGAGDIGLMGAVANATQTAGGETFGVIPAHLMRREVGKIDLSRFIVTENMHERKKVMFMNCDAIIVLPGGAGSLDEFFEVLTWRQLGLHEKPIFLANINGYWDPLVGLVDHVISEGFADASLRDFIQVVDDLTTLEDGLVRAFS
ncbi:MAG: TIGR00730 family Rossman fold protein [Pseudopelagicola sp.]|nr:TIGR00730 family Rossman fold protein [Pseudopelagicola sp.]